MPLFLTIREGPAPDDSYPIIATADQDLIQLFVRGLTRKLSCNAATVPVLKAARHPKTDIEHTKPEGPKNGEGK